MNHLLERVQHNLFDPTTLIGAVFFGIVFFVAATALATFVRKAARRVRPHLSVVTGLSFASALGRSLPTSSGSFSMPILSPNFGLWALRSSPE